MRIPAYCRHRPTNLAYVTVREANRRRVVYLGVYGSEESKKRYAAVVAALSAGQPLPRSPDAAGLSVEELRSRWLERCRHYHRSNDPTANHELRNQHYAADVFVAACAGRAAAALGKADFVAVRDALVARGLCRDQVNKHLGRIRRLCRWAADEGQIGRAHV